MPAPQVDLKNSSYELRNDCMHAAYELHWSPGEESVESSFTHASRSSSISSAGSSRSSSEFHTRSKTVQLLVVQPQKVLHDKSPSRMPSFSPGDHGGDRRESARGGYSVC